MPGLLVLFFLFFSALHTAAELIHATGAVQMAAQAAGGHDILFTCNVAGGTRKLRIVVHGGYLSF